MGLINVFLFSYAFLDGFALFFGYKLLEEAHVFVIGIHIKILRRRCKVNPLGDKRLGDRFCHNAALLGRCGARHIDARRRTKRHSVFLAAAKSRHKDCKRTGCGKLLKETFSDANGYFAILMDKEMLSGISLPDFAGASVAAATSADDLKSKGNIWSVLGGIGSCGSYTPIFWTRNLNTASGITKADFGSADADDAKSWADKLEAKTMPFGAELVVVIRKGGAMQVIKSKQLSDYTFLAGATNDTEAIEIFNAQGTGEDSSQDDE